VEGPQRLVGGGGKGRLREFEKPREGPEIFKKQNRGNEKEKWVRTVFSNPSIKENNSESAQEF